VPPTPAESLAGEPAGQTAAGDAAGETATSGPRPSRRPVEPVEVVDLAAPVPPRYGEASIIDIMPSVLAALTNGTAGFADPLGFGVVHAGLRRAVVLLVDGLGFHQLDAAGAASPTIADFAGGRFGTIDRLTAGFPSTTPVSLAGIATGAVPGAHGILGFTLRVPGEDRVLNHIRWLDDPPPSIWQPVATVFERARAAGVAVRVVSRPEFEGSGLTTAVYRGADYIGATGTEPVADAIMDALGDSVGDSAGPTLVYGYVPNLDHAGHAYGPGSDQWFDEARRLERLIARLAARLPSDTALFITADHGQLTVPGDARFDLDLDARLRDGVAIVAGEPRVRYLHVATGADDDVLATWRGVLGDAALVMTRDEAVATGWYGDVAPAHLARIGDVVVVCLDRYAVVASIAEPRESELIGYHGSITAIEMEVPLITLRW
jgi:type I phosphodiesterase/nucleotide pyrophosphatase